MKSLKKYLVWSLVLSTQNLFIYNEALANIIDCDLSLNKKMPVEEYMEACDGAMRSRSGCKLNMEKFCVNGIEADILRSSLNLVLKDEGFNPVATNGVSAQDFKDSSKMYSPVQTQSGKTFSLCTKTPNLTASEISKMHIDEIPTDKGDFVLESVPAFIKPRAELGGYSFHLRIEVRGGQRRMTAEIRDVNSLDQSTAVGKYKSRALSRATGKDMNEILNRLFAYNLIKCKREETFSDGLVSEVFHSFRDLNDEFKGIFAKSYQKVINAVAPTTIKVDELKGNFQSLFDIDLNVAGGSPEKDRKFNGGAHGRNPSPAP